MTHQFKTCSYNDLTHTAQTWGPTHVVSLYQNGPFTLSPDITHHILPMTSLSRPDALEKDLEILKNLAQSLPDNSKVLIHCQYGHSRSPAVQILMDLVSRQTPTHSLTPEDVHAAVENARSENIFANPTDIILVLTDSLLSLKGTLQNHI